MPRKSLYVVEEVLAEAVTIFREHSYYGSVMDEIIARTQFNRRGFYIEFGSKKKFLYQVLEFYQNNHLKPALNELTTHNGLDSISLFFDKYIQIIHGKGCLLINIIAELGNDDLTIRNIGRNYLDKLQFSFIACLEQAKLANKLSSNINIESTALQLTSYVQGFAINSVLSDSKEELIIATQSLIKPLFTTLK